MSWRPPIGPPAFLGRPFPPGLRQAWALLQVIVFVGFVAWIVVGTDVYWWKVLSFAVAPFALFRAAADFLGTNKAWARALTISWWLLTTILASFAVWFFLTQ